LAGHDELHNEYLLEDGGGKDFLLDGQFDLDPLAVGLRPHCLWGVLMRSELTPGAAGILA
jgi:hypothetical protein